MAEFTPLKLRHEEPNFCVSSRAYLLVSVWGRDARGRDLEPLNRAQAELIETHGYAQALTKLGDRAQLLASIYALADHFGAPA